MRTIGRLGAKLFPLAWFHDHAALHELSDSYREGRIGLPIDIKLADCFLAAEKDKTRTGDCRAIEHTKAYASEP